MSEFRVFWIIVVTDRICIDRRISQSPYNDQVFVTREKGRDPTRSYEKSPYTDRKKNAKWQHKNATKTSITHR